MRLSSFLLVGVALSLSLPQPAGAQAAVPFHFAFTDSRGPWPVGLRVAQEYDPSRSFTLDISGQTTPSDHGRPLQVVIWYPAASSSGQPMTVGDYAALVRTETSFGHAVDHGRPQDFMAAFTAGTDGLPMWAVRDAPVGPGTFPVVVYAPSLDSPSTENIELCEYLASHGYVVISSPSMGAAARRMTVDLEGANAQAADIAWLIHYAASLPDASPSQAAVIGYSWGGMAALFAAARDPHIRALISLDGSFRYSPQMVRQATDVHPDRMTLPLLYFSRAEEPLETWDALRSKEGPCPDAPDVLSEWTHGDLLHLQMLAMSHIEFSSLFLRSQRFRTDGFHFDPADYSPEDGAISYNWTARYTLEFLDAYLKQSAAAAAFLRQTPAANGVPPHLISASFRPAQPSR